MVKRSDRTAKKRTNAREAVTGKQRQTNNAATAKTAASSSERSEETPASNDGPSSEPARWPQLQPGARQVLELYGSRASELRFPGVNFEGLSEHAEQLEQFAQNVEHAAIQLEAARSAQSAAEAEFEGAARRAFAYAQVYAQEHPELHDELMSFVYATSEKPRRKKRVTRADGSDAVRGQKSANGGGHTSAKAEREGKSEG